MPVGPLPKDVSPAVEESDKAMPELDSNVRAFVRESVETGVFSGQVSQLFCFGPPSRGSPIRGLKPADYGMPSKL